MITITEAIKIARRAVNATRQGNGWVVYGPFQDEDPDGPTTCGSELHWDAAQKHEQEWRVSVALTAMGYKNDYMDTRRCHAWLVMDAREHGHTRLHAVVRFCVDRLKRESKE